MVLNSIHYFVFIALIFSIYYCSPDRKRWFLLLVGSFIFYGFYQSPLLLFVLAGIAIISYYTGICLDNDESVGHRKKTLIMGVILNLSFLIYLKYLPFIVDNINILIKIAGYEGSIMSPSPLLSVGVSFYIFQAISYLADVYFKTIRAERHFGYLALSLSFFPKLLQGPIERAGTLIPQLKKEYVFNYDNFRTGLCLISFGLFKKIVIADRLGFYTDAVYNDIHQFSGIPLILATYAYAFQIYMDFSGYTDMARGSARLFNVNLTENFRSPYLATSIPDFWRRWHITLSRWIFDYVFEPLQMKFRNGGAAATTLSLVLTFLICGFWHGANWTYLVWGLIHGIYMGVAFLYAPFKRKLRRTFHFQETSFSKILKIIITFNLVCFSMIFFRAQDLSDAFYVVLNMFRTSKGLFAEFLYLRGGKQDLFILGISFFWVFFIPRYKQWIVKLTEQQFFLRWALYFFWIIGITLLANKTSSDFIYMGF